MRTGEKRVSFACGSPLRIQSGSFHRGTFSDTQKQRAGRWQWKGSYGGLQWRGADQGRVLQLGTSLVAPTSPLSAAENQERYWVRIFPGSLEDWHRAKHPMLVCIPQLHNLHFLCTPLSVGFIPNFLLITTSTIHILAE